MKSGDLLTVQDVSDQQRMPGETTRRDAIDINDFVYAATGARVRRLTMPDGTHWFPAADVATELGYANTRDAIAKHVPSAHNKRLSSLLRTVAGGDALRKPAGHGLQVHMRMVDLQGLIHLVNGCTKPEATAFKNWVTDVIVAVQRDGCYSLERAEVQPATPGVPTAYAMPQQVADAIVRLEERNLRIDEEFALAEQRANLARGETVSVLKDLAETQRETVRALESIAAAIRALTEETARPREQPREAKAAWLPRQRPASTATASAEQLLAAWRTRVTITEDVWAVAVLLAPRLAEDGEVRVRVESLAEQTGLTEARVHDSLRFLLKRQCIRQIGTRYNAPVYAVHHA